MTDTPKEDDVVQKQLQHNADACLRHVRTVGFGNATASYTTSDPVSGFSLSITIDIRGLDKIK